MSLRFVLGSSGSGKSMRIYSEILKRAKKEPERNFLIVVPDQFTMQTQKELIVHPDNESRGILNIDVLSFGRLSHRVFEEVGRKNLPVLDDTGKSLILRKVAGQCQGELSYLGTYLQKQGYIHEIKSAISEFMQYGVSVKDVSRLMEYAKKKGALYYKLKDLQVLYDGFMRFIRDKFITTEETLDVLCEAIHKSQIVKDSVVVFDGFTGFTPIQYKVIRELLLCTEEVWLTMTLDVREDPFTLDGEQKLFHLSKKTIADVCRIARDAGIPRGEDLYMGKDGSYPRFQENAPLAHLEKSLFRYPTEKYEGDLAGEEIVLFAASTIREEVRQMSILIEKLIREKGYAYRDIAVVAGDLAGYAEQIKTQFTLLNIPCFIDRTRGIVLNPLTEYIKSALEILIYDFSYESVFRYLRSGLADFTREEVDKLENYCIQTGIRGKRAWTRQFTHRTAKMKENVDLLWEMDALRERLAEELSPLLMLHSDKTEDYVKALYDFLVKNKAAEKTAAYEEKFARQKDAVREREYAQVYRLTMQLLEQMMELLEGESMTLPEFKEILEAGFGEIEVGSIPQNVDRVLVGDMERTRLKEVKVLFFVGINDGNIPGNNGSGGIISDIDREFLRESEIELAPTPRQQMYIQRLYLYLNMTKPSERLYLSYCKLNGEGKTMRPSYLVDVVKDLFPALKVRLPELAPMYEQIYSPREGLPYLAQSLRDYAERGDLAVENGIFAEGEGTGKRSLAEQTDTLYEAYRQNADYASVVKKLMDAAFYHYREDGLSRAVAKALYGSILMNSVSRVETYAACAYRHFLQYGLKLQERQEFGFEAVDMGNVFHSVLEGFSHALEGSDYTWFDFPKEFAEKTIKEVMSLCAAEYGDTILYATARNAYAVERMERILLRTVDTLQYQLRKGSFKPESYEMSFSAVSDLDSVNISLSEEEKMKLLGRIDRVDTVESEGKIFVKIVDYKSGNKKFDIAALYYGLQLQLVLYMNAAVEQEKKKHPGKEVVPAAMLYYHVADDCLETETELTEEEINQKIRENLRANGVINKDEAVIDRLIDEKSGKSDVIPVEFKKDGTLSSRSDVMDEAEMEEISRFVTGKVKKLGREILEGRVSCNPYKKDKESACTYCPYKGVCGFDTGMDGYSYRVLPDMDKDTAMEHIRKELDEEQKKGREKEWQ